MRGTVSVESPRPRALPEQWLPRRQTRQFPPRFPWPTAGRAPARLRRRWAKANPLTNIESPDAFRSVQLVRGQREQVEVLAIDVERNLPRGLNCIGVKQHAVQLRQVSEFLERLKRSHHVVRRHDGDQDDVRPQRTQQALRTDKPFSIDRKTSDLCSWLGSRLCEEAAGLEDRRMLDRASDYMARLITRAHCADERQVVGFGAAGGKDDLVRLGAD